MLEAGVGDGYLLPMSTAVIRDDRIQEIDDDDIDYELNDPNTLLGSHANMIPLPSNVQAPRVFYGARFYNQALPVKGREAPLVQNLMYGSKEGKSFDEHYGAAAGALRADDDYEVQEVTPDYMTLRRVSDGEKVRKELYNRLPFNRKSAITHTSLVKPGDKVGKGSMLASTEYTDDEGTLALGANARVGIVPYKGHSIDDAVVISKSFSQRLTSPITKTLTQRVDNGVKTGRNHFRALFPEKYTVKQLEALDENGVVTPGSVVKPGDPIILATKPKVMSSRSGEIGNLSKSMTNVRSDASQFWDGEEEAEVMDVAKTKDGFKVIMRYETPVKDADKLVFRTGQKGVTAKIIPDEHMPRTLDGKPLEVLLNPQGLPSRANFSLLYEVLAGKVAAATGKPVKLPAFTKPGEETYDLIEKMLADAGLTDKEEVFDPMENRKLENPITVGNAYVLRLHHTGASKADSRGQGSYTKDDLPAKGGEGGAKRISGLEVNALMSSGAYATLREGATIRGTRSDDFWRTLREGNTPTKPGAPFVWNKYRALMSGAGMRMRDEGGGNIRLGPMTDEDVDKHKPIEIKNPRLINFKTMAPEEGGLFDPTLVATNKWGTITLPEPVINPAFEDVVRHLLGLKRKDLEAIMAGDMDLPPDILQKVQGMRKSASGVFRALGAGAKALGKTRVGSKARSLGSKFMDTGVGPPLAAGGVGAAVGSAATYGTGLAAGIPRYFSDKTPKTPSQSLGVQPVGATAPSFIDSIKPSALLHTGDYVGDFTPRQFMGGYGDKLDTEIAKAKSYQSQMAPDGDTTPVLDYDRIDQPFPVRQIEGFGIIGPRFMPGDNPTVIVPGDGEGMDDAKLSKNMVSEGEMTVPSVSTHEMRHAWQVDDPSKGWGDSVLPDAYKKVRKELPSEYIHGLSRVEQLGWLGGLQQELYKSRGSRMETPEDARSVLEGLTSDEGAFLKKTPIENTEVLRGTRWLKQVKDLMNSEDPKVREQAKEAYQEILQWLSNKAPSLVYGGEPDSQAIKAGSALPVSFDAGIPGPEEEDDTPTTGPAAISAALETVDLDVLEQDHRRIIDSGKVSKRKASVQALNAIEGLRKNQVKPTQLMVTKVPVVPPAFRPFSVAGNTFVPGDANELYKDLFDIRDAFKESKAVFGYRGVTGERRALQNAVRAVYGFADPVNPKTRQRGVSGFLRQISGTNPKQSFLQSKMISKPQDQTARGVIIPDPGLKMNQIGVPEDMAWNMYSSFVRRRLVRGGMKRREALEHLKERSDFAKRALQAEMKDRYVIYSRSPAWHRTNIISAEPQLVEGDAIKISPFVTTGQAGDFDGDCCRLWLTILQGGAESSHMFKDVGIKTGAVTSIRIEDMPRVEGSERQVSPTVVEYDVPSETYTLAYDTQTGEQGWYEISKFSVHEELTLHSINAGKDSFLASTDHSLIAFSRETNKVERVPPSAVITQKSSEKNWHAPCSVRGLIEADLGKFISGPHESVYADYDLGFALGIYVGDGAFSISNGEIVKALYLYGGAADSSRRKRATHMKAATTLWELFGCDSNPPRYDQYARESLGDKIGMSGRTSFNAGKEQEYMRIGYEWLKDLCGDTAEGKTLPAGMLDVHEEFRWGLFCGVIASDGTVTVTHGKAKPQLSVGLNSITSLTLASDFMALCSSLGLRAGLTEAKRKTMTGKSEYTVSVSTADLAARWKKEPFSLGCAERDELIAEHLPQVRIENTLDPVPFPGGELGLSLRNAFWEMNGQVKRGTKRNFGAGGEWFVKGAAHRAVLLPQLPALADWVRENNPELTEELDDYVRIVSDENVRWNEIIVGDAIVGETGYDITVPGPYTFCTAGGTFVYDTISLHVPATKESMEEAKSKLLPSSMLFSIKDRGRIVPALKHEQVLGLYTASKRPSKAVHRFASKEEAMDAVRRKLVPLSDEIEFPD